MTDLKELFSVRLNAYFKEVGKYARLIVNDHFSIILFVLLAFGAFYYQSFYEQLQSMAVDQVRWPIIISCLVLLIVAHLYGKPLWLTKPADESYLFARGHEWDNYWLKGSLIGLVLPSLLIILFHVLLFPFISLVTSWQANQLFGFMGLGLLLKIVSSLEYYLKIYQLHLLKVNDTWFTFVKEAVVAGIYLLSFVLPGPYHLFVPLGIALVILIIQCSRLSQRSNQVIHFEYVIDSERRRLTGFYQLVSIFADVPKLRPQVQRRKFLDRIIRPISQMNHNRYAYLYIRQLTRHGHYSGIWLRVTVFTAVLISITDHFLLILTVGATSYIMTIVQLMPMMHSNDYNPFQIIYPNRASLHVDGFQIVMAIIFAIQSIVYIILLFFTQPIQIELLFIMIGWLIIAVTLLFAYVSWWEQRYQMKFIS